MKNIMPFFAACVLFAGVACSTYSTTTDPDDLGSGNGISAEVTAEASNSHSAPAPQAATPQETTPDSTAAH
jgi:hypothetical protein